MGLKIGHFGERIRNTWKVLKCGAGEGWRDRVINDEVLHRVKEKSNILRKVKRRKANWIGHFLRRNCLLKSASLEE